MAETVLQTHTTGRDAEKERRELQEIVAKSPPWLPPQPEPAVKDGDGVGPLFSPCDVYRRPFFQGHRVVDDQPAEPTDAERLAIERRNRLEAAWAKRWREDILTGLSRPPVHETFAAVADAVRSEVSAADARIADEWKLGQAQRELERVRGWISDLGQAHEKQQKALADAETKHEAARLGARFPFKSARAVVEMRQDLQTTAEQLLEVEAGDRIAAHEAAVRDLHQRLNDAAVPLREDLARQLDQEKKEIAAFLAERLVRIERIRQMQAACAPAAINLRHASLIANSM
jgi:hypothetical protein